MHADTNLFFGIVQVFLQLTDLTSDLLLDVLLGLQSAGQLHVLIGLEEDRGQGSGSLTHILKSSFTRGAHQLDEAVLYLGQLVFEVSVLGQGSADGGLVALDVLQNLESILSVFSGPLSLSLQFFHPHFLFLHQSAQLLVVSHLQDTIEHCNECLISQYVSVSLHRSKCLHAAFQHIYADHASHDRCGSPVLGTAD